MSLTRMMKKAGAVAPVVVAVALLVGCSQDSHNMDSMGDSMELGDASGEANADDVMFVPRTPPLLSSILAVVPLQLFAYAVARARGLNVDQPRNLAKTVTVE